MDNEHDLIADCLNHDLAAQKTLYERLAPRMYSICNHFAKTRSETEDILQNGFIRVFSNLHRYRFEGSFEGWVRRIMINTAINSSKQCRNVNHHISIDLISHEPMQCEDAIARLSEKDILAILRSLPYSHWTVFNLHEIEGYGHKEIAGMLGISEGTSKSQLHRAKASIRKKMKEP